MTRPPQGRFAEARARRHARLLLWVAGWDFESEPALYLIGYFEVLAAGRAENFRPTEIQDLYGENFHVRHQQAFERQKDRLVLGKGSMESRLLEKAVPMSALGQVVRGKPVEILSPEMQDIFGTFGGKVSFQRSPTRWVDAAYISPAVEFVQSLPLEPTMQSKSKKMIDHLASLHTRVPRESLFEKGREQRSKREFGRYNHRVMNPLFAVCKRLFGLGRGTRKMRSAVLKSARRLSFICKMRKTRNAPMFILEALSAIRQQ